MRFGTMQIKVAVVELLKQFEISVNQNHENKEFKTIFFSVTSKSIEFKRI